MSYKKVAFIVPPLRGATSFYPPFGALSIAQYIEVYGYETKLFDFDANRMSLEQQVKQVMDYNPDAIGVSAVVATTYKTVLELTDALRLHPDCTANKRIVVGGGLSSVKHLLLDHYAIDKVIEGEGEIKFLNYMQELNNLPQRYPEEIIDLDDLPYPDFNRLNLNEYRLHIKSKLPHRNLHPKLFEKGRSPHLMRINSSKGCVNACSFCYRHSRGWRSHTMNYLADYIRYMIGEYDIGHISFGDECFGSNKKWLWTFVDMIRLCNIDLTFHITGMRTDIVDKEILQALYDIGVWHIQFGFESGSDTILKAMNKRTTARENKQVLRWCEEIGIDTVPFIILGYPEETKDTLKETYEFVKGSKFTPRPTLPIAMPGTWLYEYAKAKGYIKDDHEYLLSISDTEADSKQNIINYTDLSSKELLKWMKKIKNCNRSLKDRVQSKWERLLKLYS